MYVVVAGGGYGAAVSGERLSRRPPTPGPRIHVEGLAYEPTQAAESDVDRAVDVGSGELELGESDPVAVEERGRGDDCGS